MTAELDKERLLAKFSGNPPADRSAISRFEAEARVRLPDDFALFLQQMNGGDGFVGDAYVILWRVEELLETNKAYKVADRAPGFLGILRRRRGVGLHGLLRLLGVAGSSFLGLFSVAGSSILH